MKERIKLLWSHLEVQKVLESGYVKTLVDSSFNVPVFLSIVFPERNRALLIAVPVSVRELPQPFSGRGIKLKHLISDDDKMYCNVMLSLTDNSFTEVFDVLIEDCLIAISTGANVAECMQIFAARLSAWRNMLEEYSNNGLTPTAQQGLFGELILLLRLLRKYPYRAIELVTAWQGPDKFRQDFQCKDWAIEVKTTTGQDSVVIANELQLSTFRLKHLFLWNFALDRHKGQGATLNDLVAEIGYLINHNPKAIAVFNTRLVSSGYYAHQSDLYEGFGYFIREEKIFSIADQFPALTDKNIPKGISKVTYTLSLSTCIPFIVEEEEVYSIINL